MRIVIVANELDEERWMASMNIVNGCGGDRNQSIKLYFAWVWPVLRSVTFFAGVAASVQARSRPHIHSDRVAHTFSSFCIVHRQTSKQIITIDTFRWVWPAIYDILEPIGFIAECIIRFRKLATRAILATIDDAFALHSSAKFLRIFFAENNRSVFSLTATVRLACAAEYMSTFMIFPRAN